MKNKPTKASVWIWKASCGTESVSSLLLGGFFSSFYHNADKRSPAHSVSFIFCIGKCLLGNKQYTKNWKRTKNADKQTRRIHPDWEENNPVFPFSLNLIKPIYRSLDLHVNSASSLTAKIGASLHEQFLLFWWDPELLWFTEHKQLKAAKGTKLKKIK